MDMLKHFEIYDNIFRIRAPGYDPGPGPGNGTFGGIGKIIMDVIVGDKYAALWDTGNGDVDLKGYIEQNITDKPLIVFNSHGHLDHCRGNAQFDEVWIHEADVKMCRFFTGPDFDMYGHPYCEAVKNGGDFALRTVQEGQVFDLGGRTLTIYFLPGHTRGCICALDSKCKVLFSGDAILKRVGVSGMGRQELRRGFEHIKEADFETILGGHWDLPLDREQVDRFIRIIDEFTPEKAVPAINTLGGEVQKTFQYYLGSEFADPEFASISFSDPQFFYTGVKEGSENHG